MSLKEQMESAVKALSESHAVNSKAYRDALAARKEADALVRKTCDVAHVSANELGAAKKALEELNRNTPVIEASGQVGA